MQNVTFWSGSALQLASGSIPKSNKILLSLTVTLHIDSLDSSTDGYFDSHVDQPIQHMAVSFTHDDYSQLLAARRA